MFALPVNRNAWDAVPESSAAWLSTAANVRALHERPRAVCFQLQRL